MGKYNNDGFLESGERLQDHLVFYYSVDRKISWSLFPDLSSYGALSTLNILKCLLF